MTDILIRGMEMPKTICGEPGYVDVRIFADGSVIMAKAAPPYYGKFEATPLPAGHGRLIDADAIRKEIDANRPGRIYEDGWALTVMDHAPTIVPAEGGTDNVP